MGLAGRRDLDPLVLVVDDEVSVRQALERALRLEGFAVSTAATGRAALEQVAQRPPAVVVLEQLLEQVWGYGFEVETNVVDVFVGYLRRKLDAGGEPRMLHTVRGVGWALRP